MQVSGSRGAWVPSLLHQPARAAILAGVTTLGVISDTHGQLRPEAMAALAATDRLLHAGDLDDVGVLERLRARGSVTVVRGNMDRGAWARGLPEYATFTLDGVKIHVIHDLSRLAFDPRAEGIAVVVHGHTHQPRRETRDGVLYLNPGSAGPRRYGCPISVARLVLGPAGVASEIVILDGLVDAP